MSTLTLAPMTLGDIFDRLFKLIGKTWLKSLILALIVLAPAGLIMGITFDFGLSELADSMGDNYSERFTPEDFEMILGLVFWFGVGLFLLMIGTLIATVAITIVGCAEMSGEPLSWQEALSRTFYVRVLKVLGQGILESFLIGAIVVIPYAMLVLGIAADSFALGLTGGLLIFGAIFGAIYLGISFAFTTAVISWEDADIIESFKRSWSLVKDHWWRTFGILILMSLMVSFAVSVVMTPLYLIVLWDFFRMFFDRMSTMEYDSSNALYFVDFLRSFGFSLGIISGIASILELMVRPLYSVVIYFDLRARHGELGQVPAPAQS